MRTPARGRLLWRLLGVQAALVVAALAAAWLAVETHAADSFMALMKEYSIDTAEVEAMFRNSVRTALTGVAAAAVLAAFAMSWWITRRILRPLDELTEGSRRLAAGERGYRIPDSGANGDELTALVRSFNDMAEALEHNEAVRRALVVDVAHELRTPLTNLRGTVEALQDGLLEPGPESLEALLDELERLGRLTEELVAAGRDAERRARPQRRERTDLRALVEHTAGTFQARLLRRRLTVDLEFAGDCTAAVDPDQLTQVLANLLQNALQFAPEGSRLVFAGERVDDTVRIECRNRGSSIPDADRELVFEPYYRIDRSRTRSPDGGGAGLGLAIVRGLIAAHGGQVGAWSEGDVTGVWVTVPASPA